MFSKGILLFLILIFVHSSIIAQKVENIHFEQIEKQIIVYYDLVGTQLGQTFNVQVYCSTDGGKTLGSALSKVIGDVGSNQIGGFGKRITWDVLRERERLTGDILFEIHVLNTSKFATLTDQRDGKIYKSVKIGSQVWMAENLNYETSTGSWRYDNNSSNCEKYGRLYTWKSAITVCPAGWHLPSDSDWQILTAYLGGVNVAGGKLKSITEWNKPNTDASNESGFSALPSGYRDYGGAFFYIGSSCGWWTLPLNESPYVWYRFLDSRNNRVSSLNSGNYSTWGFSIRCLKNN